MTHTPKSDKPLEALRDEMAEKEYPVCYIRDADVNFQGRLGFKDGFDASTKYHEEKLKTLLEQEQARSAELIKALEKIWMNFHNGSVVNTLVCEAITVYNESRG